MKGFFYFILKTVFWSVIVSVFCVLVYRWIPVYITPLMLIRAYETKEWSWQHNWTPISDISKNIQLAVICSEDQQFPEHNGFDMKAIKKAMNYNKSGRKIRGASTISQQTAKNVFLWPERSWFRKGLETYFTFLIELLWPKERILEVYLNSIEMGNGVYGIEAAAGFWFHKGAESLTLDEACAIAAILPNPKVYKARPATRYIGNRKAWILRQIRNYGPLILDEDPIDKKKK